METALYCIIAFVAAAAATSLYFKRRMRAVVRESEEQLLRVRELERQFHLKDVEALRSKNDTELVHFEALRSACEKAKQEGIAQGRSECEKDYLLQKTQLEAKHQAAIALERQNAADDARKQLRAEIATQTKMFSVAIFPYVRIEIDEGLIWDNRKASAGYQYQLLINGIPAFEPHVVKIEETMIKEVDEEVKKRLLDAAEKAVTVAIATYLPEASADLFKRGTPIFKEEKK